MTTDDYAPDAAPANFIRDIILRDLESGRVDEVVTRFPPEPNGYLHFGHAKSICLNFGLGEEFGRCHLRFDDTNPETEDQRYVEAAQRDVRWLGFDWGDNLFFASEYFEQLYEYAERMIVKGLAYVDSLSDEEIRAYRGTVSRPGRPSPYRDRSVAENLDLFRGMRAGEFAEGEHVLRARIDLAADNMKMRDPLLYRIRHAPHYRRGTRWCIFPFYDFAHCLSDAIEGVTHSLCTLEFENNRELYDWILDACDVPQPRPRQIEFARLSVTYTVLSKRWLKRLVEEGKVEGWDDPRMPTLAGLRRRGVTPEAIRTFADMIGVARANSTVDEAQFHYVIRNDLNRRAPRVLCVLDPLEVVLTNYPEGRVEELEAPLWPHDVGKEGHRLLPLSRRLYIERADFMENPPRSFHRLAPGREVRLRHAYIIRCDEVERDAEGRPRRLYCSYDPATRSGSTGGRRVKGTIHWVSADEALPIEVRLLDHLFDLERPELLPEGASLIDTFNPRSMTVVEGFIEPSVGGAAPGSRFQFERLGYFVLDETSSRPDRLVANRIVELRDRYRKDKTDRRSSHRERRDRPAGDRPGAAARPASGPKRSAEQQRRYEALCREGIPPEPAEVLAAAPALEAFFREALRALPAPQPLAVWVANDLVRALRERGLEVADVPFPAAYLARLVGLVEEGSLTRTAAKTVFEALFDSPDEPARLVRRLGLDQTLDDEALESMIDAALEANPEKAAQIRAGKTQLMGFFVGQVLRAAGGRADPRRIGELLRRRFGPR